MVILEANMTVAFAFLAGLVSFLSPCVIPLVPTYITYLTGSSVVELTEEKVDSEIRRRIIVNSLAFILGFSLVFISFGLTASFLGQFLTGHQTLIRKISGIIVIIFGLSMMGVFKFSFLEREAKLSYNPSGKTGVWNSLAIGAVFSAGWTPCIGPILSSILILAGNSETLLMGAILLAAYSLGLGLPFFATALALNRFMKFMPRLNKYMGKIRILSGILLIVVGIMIYQNYFLRLSGLLNWSF